MIVREAQIGDRAEWARMRKALWPGADADHDTETLRHFSIADESVRVFVAVDDGTLIGFLELELRKYAPGCQSSPVPFIEGWYVERRARKRGVGRALVRAAEAWARDAGFEEIASDTEVANADGIAAHRALGYSETERVVCFRRSLT
jgi:aminoglycoside 6'-N-acetyltransferase I